MGSERKAYQIEYSLRSVFNTLAFVAVDGRVSAKWFDFGDMMGTLIMVESSGG